MTHSPQDKADTLKIEQFSVSSNDESIEIMKEISEGRVFNEIEEDEDNDYEDEEDF